MRQGGFFSTKELSHISAKGGVALCSRCGLFQNARSPRMPVSGLGRKAILIVAEAPGEDEDEAGTQLVGKAGKLLEEELAKLDINMRKDCWLTNSVNCHPPKNRTPTNTEVESCRPMLLSAIAEHKPTIVLLLGNAAIQSYLGTRVKKDLRGINRWRGFAIPDRVNKCWVLPTYHPSFIMRQEKNPATRQIWKRDLQSLTELLDARLPYSECDEEKCIKTTQSLANAKTLLSQIAKQAPRLLAFDYETPGLKPEAEWMKVVCVSVCWSLDKAFAFTWDDSLLPLWTEIMSNPKIRKIASNISFEHQWTQVRLGVTVKGWGWDTMLASRILDKRKGTSSIKFQALVRYGIEDYNSDVAPFLKASSKEKKLNGANAKNQIHEVPTERLLIYCGMDSLLEYRVAMDQMRQVGIIQ